MTSSAVTHSKHFFSPSKLSLVNPGASSPPSPLSRSHSGDEAPLHSLRGPSTGEMRPKSDSEMVLGRSRLQGRETRAGDDVEEDEEGVGDGQSDEDVPEEEEPAKGQGDRSSWGLLGVDPRLLVERVSESSSDMKLLPPHGSSSKHSEATGEKTRLVLIHSEEEVERVMEQKR